VEAQPYINVWGVWPEDDPGKSSVNILEVVALTESPFRLPLRFAEVLYRAGESGMGYIVFTMVFSDGTKASSAGGNAVDFVALPPGKTPADIVEVLPHVGRDSGPMTRPKYSWCLYGAGKGSKGSLRFA
jgi:hypothetical protein